MKPHERPRIDDLRALSDEQKAELIRDIENTAVYYEHNFYGCARCTFAALQKHLGLGDNDTLKATFPFAGGGARHQELCGAVSGALMAIGVSLASGKMEWDFETPRFHLMMEQASRVMDGFKAEFGTLRCYEIGKLLHGRYWDFTDPSQLEERLKPEVHQKCEGVVKVAVSLAAQVLLEPVDIVE